MTEGGGMIVQRRDSFDGDLDDDDGRGSPAPGDAAMAGLLGGPGGGGAVLLAGDLGAGLDGTAGEHALPLEVVRAQARA